MSKIFLDKFALSVAETIAKYTDSARERSQPYHADGQEFPEDQLEKDVKQVNALIKKPAFTLGDLDAYRDALKHINTSGIDDRLLLLEKLLILMSRLSESRWKEQADKLQEFVIQTLYDDLPHPPSSYIASLDNQATVATAPKGVKYAFRSADGSNYNPLFPSLGKAGSPYARTVPAVHHVPKHVLPDPGLVFDTLLKRDKFEEHPGGISSLFFAFADLIIHCIFDTNHADWTINNTSSYLDLSILYGNSQADQDQVRRKDGSGKLWDDTFADPRLLLMPPATCALLVLLSRNHNYIAQKLLDINENGNLVRPYPEDQATRQKQDDEIFHRARLVNCGYFIKIILGDYVGSILGLVRDGSAWRLDPMLACRESNHQVSPRGEGNVCSVEFNLLYRWHATLSEQDTKWTTDLFSDLFKKDFGEVSINDFKQAAHRVLIPDADVKKREFGGLHRQADGRFKDSELAKIIQDATEWRAGAFKARGIPAAMRIIEVMGIEQARSWGTCSLNEFRKFLGLKPYKNFKEWNKNEEIHTAAAALYKDIDNLELHVGLQAEEAKSPSPGAGLCPGYTISRAILSDAVALTRGDRYLTTEFTPANLTAWGYADCQYDPLDGSYGGMLTKLLFRHLPEYYPAGSAYAHFPFLEPKFMKKNLEQNDPSVVGKYDWNRPPVPTPFVPATTYAKVEEIVKNPSVFVSAYNTRLHVVTAPGLSRAKAPKAGITSDIDKLVSGRKKVERLLGPGKTKAWDQYFRDEIDSLLQDKSTSRVGSKDVKYVDIVADVINLLPVHWISEEIIGLPLKTVTWQGGEWRQERVYQRFADIGRYIFLNFDPDADYRLRESALDTFEKVHKFGKGHLDATCSFFKATVEDTSAHKGIESHNCHAFVKQVKDAIPEATTSEVATYIFSAVVPTAAHFSQAIAHVVDFYLDDGRKAEREDIVKHSKTLDETASVEKVMGYVREALRINPTVRGFYRTTSQAAKLGAQEVPAGAKVFASVIDANQDKSAFGPDASLASFNRGAERSGILGIGEHGLLSAGFFEWVVPAILGQILGLKGLKRAPGISGKFSKFEEDWHGSKRQLYFDADGKITPFPASLIVQYTA